MASSSSDDLCYPLSSTFFGCMPLTPQRLHGFRDDGDAMIDAFASMVLTPDDRSMLWRDMGTHDGAQLFEGDILGLNLHKAGVTPFRGVAKICGTTIDEVAQLYRFETRDDCVEFVELHQRDVLLDLMTLYTLHERTPESPFKQTYIQWAAASSPLPALIRARDFVFLEAQDEILLPSGKRAWVSCQQSIALDSVPCLADTTLQLARGHLHQSGLLVMETDRVGELDVIYHFAADLKGRMASWARKMLFKRRMLAVSSLYDSIQKLRFSHQPLKTQHECHWEVPKAASYYKSCALCYATSRFKKLECCQSCTQAVCNKCSRVWQLQKVAVHGEGKARICSACATSYRSYALSRHYTIAGSPYDSTASSSMGWTKNTPQAGSFAGAGWSRPTAASTPSSSSFVGNWPKPTTPMSTTSSSSFVGKEPKRMASDSFLRAETSFVGLPKIPSAHATSSLVDKPKPKRMASDSFLKAETSSFGGGHWEPDVVMTRPASNSRSYSVSKGTPRHTDLTDLSYVTNVMERSEGLNRTLLGDVPLVQLIDDDDILVLKDPPPIRLTPAIVQ
ncbi:hypothetical protein SDRG_03634 [Saprolegnia diclina VS20]|uniref:START domain-containing protein n=1 Tax=Saprolegnia diclina (strain VS20) TaxID=1156394 RepID=T0QXM9_SAPDV|nr:hypothetical protein SDRG_03634 [Saprolegnia diclina VS20]EQC39431.1 hypothetical protein SDRG_03634 [Saprolegnia diclina VS20]|eukprot:XP_008607492.1 hypothetical protein SDRG_03634 [Saprolegnia diclina VS20]